MLTAITQMETPHNMSIAVSYCLIMFQLFCCGVSGYRNWENNIYFNCTSPGGEACGVPFSCCKPTNVSMQHTG